MSLYQLAQWIEMTEIATAFRESVYMYPLIEGTHVLGLAMSVGTVLWFDLRLVGWRMKDRPVSEVFGAVKPWMFLGFGIMVVSGGILLLAHVTQAYLSWYFRAKVILLFLAAINVATYHLTIDRRKSEWDNDPIPPGRARLAGAASIILWTTIIAVGRLMAYHLSGG
jgi:hypothetical protein